MTYTDILQVDERFQSSINLQFDIGDLHKIDCYIPTDQSVQVLREYLNSIYYGNKNEFATVLVGPYGKGKSHLILVLLTLIASDALFTSKKEKAECLKVINRLISRIEAIDSDVAALAKAVLTQKKRLLPVIIDSNATEINQVLILSLKHALERCGIENLLPEMNFDVAIKMISRWETEYPDAFEKLKNELLPYKYTVEELRDSLKSYSKVAYDTFVSVYPTVTSGSSFAPLFFDDALQLYKSISNALITQTEFGGMFIVFDEFSKYLEANLDQSRMMNFKLIQELAELATRSSEAELCFTCITHKDLLNYNNSDSFRTIVGRFKQIEYVHSSEQAYELIANAIEKKPGFHSFLDKYSETISSVKTKIISSGLFNSIDQTTLDETILTGCYPLAPMSAYGLLRISEKVAQNERTLFTFLASQDKNSVMSFIKNSHSGMEFITLDMIYDYFAPSFETEVFNKSIHSIWAKASSALRVAETELQKKIIKALAAILIIGDDQARPNAVCLKAALLINDEQFIEATDKLCELQILTKRDVSSEFAFLTANGVDIKKNLQNYISNKLPTIQICQELEHFVDPGYILPRQYNNDYRIIRFFRRVFMDASLFCAYQSGDEIVQQYGADGVLIQIITLAEPDAEVVLEHYKQMRNTQCMVLAINEQGFGLERRLKELVAIQALKQTEIAKADSHYADELEIYEEDLMRYLQKQITWDFSTTNEKCKYYYDGEWLVSLTKGMFLSRLASRICNEVYTQTPKINNEMINKTYITGPIKKARMEIVSKLLHSDPDEKIEWSGYGPEVSIYRSMFTSKKIDGLRCEEDPNLELVLQEINAFAHRAVGNKLSMGELYTRLLSAPYGVRKGIIPAYIAYVFRRIEGEVTYYWGDKEYAISAETLENVDAEPDKYMLFIDETTDEKERYIHNLCNLYDVDFSSSNRNNLIISAMQRWLRSLSKIARNAKQEYNYENGHLNYALLPENILLFRKSLLAFDVNVRELLMEDIPQKVFSTANYDETFSHIEKARSYLDGYTQCLKNTLIAFSKDSFAPGYEGSLAQAISIWHKSRTERALIKLYDAPTNQLLKYISTLDTNDDEVIVSQLGFILESFSIEDWSDENVINYEEKLKNALETIKATDQNMDASADSAITITITKNTNSFERMVDGKEISTLGKTLINNLRYSFDEYGDSISSEEKVAILVEILKEVIGEA